MKKKFLLQLFAEGAGEGTGEGNGGSSSSEGAGNTEGAGGSSAQGSGEQEGAIETKYTDEDIDRIFTRKFAEMKKKQEKEVEKVKEAERLASLSSQEKTEHELSQIKKQLEEYEKKESLAEMTKTARTILAESNINVSDELLGMMVSDNADDTKAAVDSFKEAFSNAVEKAVKERVKGETPPRSTGTSGNTTMAKEKIMAIKNPELRQKKMLENKHLFNF
jgi:hypothetical protein